MSKVSVIIPCYNHGIYLNEAINSVLVQSYKNIEIIVINDGSTDEKTVSLLNKICHPAVKVIHISNGGVSKARNVGISQSSGDYILPLDSDDWIDESFIEIAVAILNKDNTLEIVGSGVEYFGDFSSKEMLPLYSPKHHLLQNLFFNTSLFRKNSFQKINGYDESLLTGWEDWDFYLRLISKSKQVYIIPEFLYHYRIKKVSRNAMIINEIKQKLEQQFFKKHLEKYLIHFPEPINEWRDNLYMKSEIKQFEKYKIEIYNTYSYRIGNFILVPLKFFKKIFNAKKWI